MTEEELAAIEKRDGCGCLKCTDEGDKDVTALLAEVRRLRALPIIEVCNDCAYMRVTQAGARAECGRTRDYLGDYENGDRLNPTAKCPLKAKQNQRDVK